MRIHFIHCLILLILLTMITPIISQDFNLEPRLKNISVSSNGTFVSNEPWKTRKVSSENGDYWCDYEIGRVGDEVREIVNFKFFENDQLLYELKQTPGSDLYISNCGNCAFMDLTYHYKGELTLHFYSKAGQHLMSETVKGASLFGFSVMGNKFGVGNAKFLKIISIPDHRIDSYEGGYQFDISEDENLVAVASSHQVKVYLNGELIREFQTDFFYTRKIRVSSKYNFLAVIDKKQLKVYSLSTGKLIFQDNLKGKNSFRDLVLNDDKILAGIHYRDKGVSKGILKIYDLQGQVLLEKVEACKDFKTFEKKNNLQKSSLKYDQILWPFFPFDSVHTVWNYYEQHMSYGQPDWSYLHQGLDIIVPINEPTYAVAPGIVKCVLTISANFHWRIAISREQTADFSKGWLYAHLIQSTIQFDVGDTVQQFDYLGDIIQWAEDWGHIHFVEIEDSGSIWQYWDNEWGITYNPLLSLRPHADLIPPIIENVFPNSKFAFCLNETSNYLDPDSLYGDIDIIAKIVDYIGDSAWQLPAYQTFYWVKKLPEDTIVFQKTLGQILNHHYDFYDSDNYTPYATLIYKRDALLAPPYWMDTTRNYFHILTNNNGDSLLDLSEKELAFSTTNYLDGNYRIFVEARDEYGNSTVDSMDVKFKNGLTLISEQNSQMPLKFQLFQNCPNPFNPSTTIRYSIPEPGHVNLRIYDLLGHEITTLVDEFQEDGNYSIDFNGKEFASGIYFYQLKLDKFFKVKKMLLMH
ncbi:T9SS type A sorting domain-containing protein [candidate division KSB1 bacterium]|nr:T9SS type A sorting domain-containing protein [candidate division KSB1 bacterium]